MRDFIVGALLVTAGIGNTPALAQNESESAKSGLKAPVMSAPPPAVPAEQRVTMQPGTNVVNTAAALVVRARSRRAAESAVEQMLLCRAAGACVRRRRQSAARVGRHRRRVR